MLSLLSRAESLSSTLPPLLAEAEQVAMTVAQGIHGRRRVGQGDSFWQYRAYQPDDPATLVDWRQSARSDKLFVRQTEWEAAQTVWLWRDASASMNYHSATSWPRKHRRASLIVLALAVLLIRGGERVALLDGSLPPVGGRTALMRLATLLDQTRRKADESKAGDSLPDSAPVPRHAQVLLAGDFFAPLETIDAAVRRLSGQGARGVLLQVCDPAEETFPFKGRIRFRGPEDEGELVVRRAEDMGDAYRARLKAHNDGIRAIAQAASWPFISHRTDASPQAALLSLYTALSQQGTR